MLIFFFFFFLAQFFFLYSCIQAEWIIQDSRPPDGWPQNGNITFEDFDLRYREGLPLVLKNINCVITPGEKVNIVQDYHVLVYTTQVNSTFRAR